MKTTIFPRLAAAVLMVGISVGLAGAPTAALAKDKHSQEEILKKKKAQSGQQSGQKTQAGQKSQASKHKPDSKPQSNSKQQHKTPAKNAHANPDWKHKGGKMPKNFRGEPVDYRKHNLKQPPKGYQWVRHNNDYVLIAISTGIVSAIINATR